MKIVCVEREGRWLAHAVHDETGRPFGIECAAETEQEASDRLTQWLGWQKAHADALEALQHAQRGYHRTIAGSAFANPTEGPTAVELQRDALEAVETARVRLDEVRARKPD